MAAGERPNSLTSVLQDSATLISRGELCVYNSTSDCQKVVRSGANTAKPAGVAFETSPGQSSTSLGIKPFLLAQDGCVKVKVGAAGVTQGSFCEADANGLAVDATAGAGRNTYGRILETGASGDFVLLEVRCQRITV